MTAADRETPTTPGTTSRRPTASARRATLAAAAGHLVEFYDFSIYGYAAVIIGPLFFPSEDPVISLLSVLLVFGSAFLVRPVGGVLLGRLADRRGRRPALIAGIALMGLSTTAVGFLPTYAQIGVAAPVLLVVARLLQGISSGGESPDAATFVREWAPPSRKGAYLSLIPAAGNFGKAGAAGVAALVAAMLPAEAMSAWGWRVPFLLACPLLFVCLYLRLRVDDSPQYVDLKAKGGLSAAPFTELLRDHRAAWTKLFLLCFVQGTASYVGTIYVAVYMTAVLGMSTSSAGLVVLIATTFGAFGMIALGLVADRWGRRRILVASYVAYVVASTPMFALMAVDAVAALVALVVMMIPYAFILVGSYGLYGELLPTRVRGSGLAVGHSLAAAISGGGGPYLATWLIDRTGDQLVPAYLLAAGGLIGLATIWRMRPAPPGSDHEYV